MSRRKRWMMQALGWDGLLPGLVATSTEMLALIIPVRGLVMFLAVFVIPLVAALIRAEFGKRRFDGIGADRPARGRVFLFAVAVILLVAFECLIAVLQIRRAATPWPWFGAVGLYLAYLGSILVALRPDESGGEAKTPGSRRVEGEPRLPRDPGALPAFIFGD